MSENVVKYYPPNAAEDPDNVLEQAIGQFKSVLIIGFNHNGLLEARANTGLTSSEALWLAQRFSFKLLAGEFFDDEEDADCEEAGADD